MELVSWSAHVLMHACTSRFCQVFRPEGGLCYCAWLLVNLTRQNKMGGGRWALFHGCRFEKIQVWPKGGIFQTAAVWSFLSRVQPAGRGRMKLTEYTQKTRHSLTSSGALLTWLAQTATSRRQSGMLIWWSRLSWATLLGTQSYQGVLNELTVTLFSCFDLRFFCFVKLK